MRTSNICFVFTFCFGFCSLVAISGSQQVEGTQYPQAWMKINTQPFQEGANGGLAFFQVYLDIAQKFLKYEKRTLENFLANRTRKTPQVIIDLPPANSNFSKIKDL